MTPRALKALFLMIVLVVSSIGQSVDFTRGCMGRAGLDGSSASDGSCTMENDSGCAMHCPKGSCCCGKPLPPVIPGMVYFKGFQCGPDDFGTGEVIFPQFFAWKFVPGNGHVGFAVPDYSREPIGQAQDFAADFRSSPPTPPPRSV